MNRIVKFALIGGVIAALIIPFNDYYNFFFDRFPELTTQRFLESVLTRGLFGFVLGTVLGVVASFIIKPSKPDSPQS
jgi:hypothetical protein